MGISSVLVDRGRVWTNTVRYTVASPGHPSVPLKVEGSTVYDWAASGWFACRIDSPAAAEARDAAQGRERPDQRPTLIYDLEDEAGNPVFLDSASRVEVDSEALGLHMWDVTGTPTLYRKKEDLVAGEAQISRLTDDWPAGLPHPGFAELGVGASGAGTTGEVGAGSLAISQSASETVV
jgi:hypothetical protein